MNNEIIYFDNAATSWPKPEQVYAKTDEIFRNTAGNPGRGINSNALLGKQIINDARKEIAEFFNVSSPDYVIFTDNGTDSLNIAIKGLISPGDKVLITPFEHNSVTRPLLAMQKIGVEVKVANKCDDLSIDLDSVKELCKDGINYAVISHVSNVTGVITDVYEISKIVHESGGLVILDAAQSAGSLDIDIRTLDVDVIAAPGHKGLMGPMGTGILLLADNLPIKPFREGGTGIFSEEDFQPKKLPYRLEAGTSNLPAIAGLLEGIRFIKSAGIEAISAHEKELALYLMKSLKEMKGIHIFSGKENSQTGVVSFTSDSIEPSVIETVLDQIYQIQVRSGLHCSPYAHRSLGTFPEGTVRASFGYYNTKEQIDIFLSALQSIVG